MTTNGNGKPWRVTRNPVKGVPPTAATLRKERARLELAQAHVAYLSGWRPNLKKGRRTRTGPTTFTPEAVSHAERTGKDAQAIVVVLWEAERRGEVQALVDQAVPLAKQVQALVKKRKANQRDLSAKLGVVPKMIQHAAEGIPEAALHVLVLAGVKVQQPKAQPAQVPDNGQLQLPTAPPPSSSSLQQELLTPETWTRIRPNTHLRVELELHTNAQGKGSHEVKLYASPTLVRAMAFADSGLRFRKD